MSFVEFLFAVPAHKPKYNTKKSLFFKSERKKEGRDSFYYENNEFAPVEECFF